MRDLRVGKTTEDVTAAQRGAHLKTEPRTSFGYTSGRKSGSYTECPAFGPSVIVTVPPRVVIGSALSWRSILKNETAASRPPVRYFFPPPVSLLKLGRLQENSKLVQKALGGILLHNWADMSGLHHEYVRRVVETLANFEDELIATAGFFAREEHFESCMQGVRTEFEADRRAIAIFAVPGSVSALIDTLSNAEMPAPPSAPKERRRFENAFAATVLLSSSTGVRGIMRNPPLLEQLWEFVERPAQHPVLLHYWARCAGTLLASPDRTDGLKRAIAVLGLRRLLVPLVRLIDCEAVRTPPTPQVPPS